jgi:hypothetical protein
MSSLSDYDEERNTGAGGQSDRTPIDNENAAGNTSAEPPAGWPGGEGDGAGSNVDLREALFNDGAIGPIGSIQVSTERIVSLRGIMFDLDPDLFVQSGLIASISDDAAAFYRDVVKPMLDRHPVLKKTEVRMTGRGLHVILRFAAPIEFTKPGEREEWAGIVEVVQTALPIDPGQPGITATTRAVGSRNGKNDAVVELLEEGSPVTADEVRALCDEMCKQPFRTVMSILAGSGRLQPCPICKKADSAMAAGDRAGKCYGCGSVALEQLYDLVLAPKHAAKEKKHAKAR